MSIVSSKDILPELHAFSTLNILLLQQGFIKTISGRLRLNRLIENEIDQTT